MTTKQLNSMDKAALISYISYNTSCSVPLLLEDWAMVENGQGREKVFAYFRRWVKSLSR